MAQWTDERVELLKKLWGQGVSASQIAERLGGLSHTSDGGRLAVLGKVHRLVKRGVLQPRNDPKASNHRRARKGRRGGRAPSSTPQQVRSAPPIAGSIGPHLESEQDDGTDQALGPDLVIPESERRTLQQLDDDCCRWPFGDPKKPGFHFCGKSKLPGLPYCEFHARRAFVAPRKLEHRERKPPVYAGGITNDERAEVSVALGKEAFVET